MCPVSTGQRGGEDHDVDHNKHRKQHAPPTAFRR